MSTSYTKLFSSILHSTVWAEPHTTRIVWITMLAMCDQHGVVSASVPGLARAAGVTRQECEIALKAFLSPDPDSRTRDYEGRRIEPVDGGWVLLNHGKYRELMSANDRRAKDAERQARARERAKKRVTQLVTQTRDESRPRHAASERVTAVTTSEADADMRGERMLPMSTFEAPKNISAEKLEREIRAFDLVTGKRVIP